MEKFIQQKWGKVAIPKIYLNDSGVFIFRFENPEDMMSIIEGGPWFFRGNLPLVLKMWKPGFKLDLAHLTSVPVWVKLPNLDLQFWSQRMLGRIASKVGKSIMADKLTASKEKIGFARLLVDIDARSRPLEIPRP